MQPINLEHSGGDGVKKSVSVFFTASQLSLYPSSPLQTRPPRLRRRAASSRLQIEVVRRALPRGGRRRRSQRGQTAARFIFSREIPPRDREEELYAIVFSFPSVYIYVVIPPIRSGFITAILLASSFIYLCACVPFFLAAIIRACVYLREREGGGMAIAEGERERMMMGVADR